MYNQSNLSMNFHFLKTTLSLTFILASLAFLGLLPVGDCLTPTVSRYDSVYLSAQTCR